MDKLQYACKYYNIVGHVIRFNPQDYVDRMALRNRLGYVDKPLVVCSAGGTSIGHGLLELCGQAFFPERKYLSDVHMVVVLGPRIPKGNTQ